MFSQKKTFDRSELDGYEILKLMLRAWSKHIGPNLRTNCFRLDIRPVHKSEQWAGWLEYSGLMTVSSDHGDVDIRFKCAIDWTSTIVNHSWTWSNNPAAELVKPFELSIEGTNFSGKIRYVEVLFRDAPDKWIIGTLFCPDAEALNAEVKARLKL